MSEDKSSINSNRYKKMIKLPKVCEITTHSPATIYRRMSKGEFPKQVNLTERSSVWIEEEVFDYVDEKIRLRDKSTCKNFNK